MISCLQSKGGATAAQSTEEDRAKAENLKAEGTLCTMRLIYIYTCIAFLP